MTRVHARAFALMALLDGCSDEESGSAIYGAALVWSDDDSTMLIAERDFSYVGHDEESTMQLLLLDPAAAARTAPLGEPFDADTVEVDPSGIVNPFLTYKLVSTMRGSEPHSMGDCVPAGGGTWPAITRKSWPRSWSNPRMA